jgi:prophage tail gpP-like protein
MIELIVNGTPFTDFISAEATVALDTLSNDFRFTSSSVNGFPPIRKGDAVEVVVEEQLVLTGFIAEVGGQDQEGGHTVTYAGRDLTGDFVDSDINIIDDIRAGGGLTLKKIIERVLQHLGQRLFVTDDAEPAPFNAAEDIIAPEVGENAFDFVMKYAKKRQVLLSSTPSGNIWITESSPEDSGAVLQRLQGANSNNILTQDWTLEDSRVFNKYISRGQLDPVALNVAGASSSSTVENQGGQFIDDDVRAGRQKVTVESQSYSSEQLRDRARWTSQLSKAEATRFNCTARGHLNSVGDLWRVNTLVQINSDVADISRKMILKSVTFSQAEKQPTVSRLEFVDQNAYTAQTALLNQKPVGDLNDAFIG